MAQKFIHHFEKLSLQASKNCKKNWEKLHCLWTKQHQQKKVRAKKTVSASENLCTRVGRPRYNMKRNTHTHHRGERQFSTRVRNSVLLKVALISSCMQCNVPVLVVGGRPTTTGQSRLCRVGRKSLLLTGNKVMKSDSLFGRKFYEKQARKKNEARGVRKNQRVNERGATYIIFNEKGRKTCCD